MKLPEGFQSVIPYLVINEASKFIEFVTKVFDAKLTFDVKRDDGMVKHAEIKIGGTTIMAADSTEEFNPREATLMVYVENADDSFKKAVALGAEIVRDISDQEYGRTGGVLDPFGITWWITSLPK
jgi:uncharacterized glyoxalase superfamily protein PhnB